MRIFLHACIHCFTSPAQQHILYLCASYGDTVNDMCIALSNEGVMNRWWCVRLFLSHVLTASEARAVDRKCVHGVVWMMEWTHFMTNWKGKIQQAVTAQGWGSRCSQSTLFFPVLRLMRTRSQRGELELTVKLGQLFTFEFFFYKLLSPRIEFAGESLRVAFGLHCHCQGVYYILINKDSKG